MPVRSSLCTYSPTAVGSSAGNSASKYSSILPTSSSLSYGQYKPLASSPSSSSSSTAGFRSTPTHHYESSKLSSPAATSRNSFSRYSLTSSPSSYSPSASSSASGYSNASSCSLSSSSGLYKQLDSPSLSSRYGNSLKTTPSPSSRYSSGSSTNSLSSSSGGASAEYSSYKSPSSSSAYSSGGSLSSTSSGSSSYVLKGRRPSSGATFFAGEQRSRPPPAGAKTTTSISTAAARSSDTNNARVPFFYRNQMSGTAAAATKSARCHFSPSDSSSSDSPRAHSLTYSRHMDQTVSAESGSYCSSSCRSDSPLPAGVPGGLINLGNTCYMNAALQSIYSIDCFRELVLTSDSGKELTSQLAELFRMMRTNAGAAQPVSPADFKYSFSRYQSKFSGFAQQDAQEFLRYLINGVHEEHNKAGHRWRRAANGARASPQAPRSSQEAWSQYRQIVDDSPLVDVLVGQLCSTITCGRCGNKSHCWDPFWDLSLPITLRRGASSPSALAYSTSSFRLRDVIDEFTAKETLDASDRFMCSRCERATESTKQISWSRLPQVLILHLKKFTNDGYKLSSPDVQIDKQLAFNGLSYQLKACVSHHGHSSCSGHYTSHCEYSGRWFHFDDARVRDVTGTFDCGKLADAYVLFYTPARRASSSGQSKL